MSKFCSGKCLTFISRRPKMGSNFVHYFLNIIKYYIYRIYGTYFRPICCAYACLGNAPEEILQTLPTALFIPVNNSYIIIINTLQKKSGSIRASFRKWFLNCNAPTRAYIDEPRPR